MNEILPCVTGQALYNATATSSQIIIYTQYKNKQDVEEYRVLRVLISCKVGLSWHANILYNKWEKYHYILQSYDKINKIITATKDRIIEKWHLIQQIMKKNNSIQMSSYTLQKKKKSHKMFYRLNKYYN